MVPEKLLFDCEHCGRVDSSYMLPADKSFTHRIITSQASHQISCPCGIMTKLCKSLQELQVVWNSRPGKPFHIPKITVTHPEARGLEPGTASRDKLEKAKKEARTDARSTDELAEKSFRF